MDDLTKCLEGVWHERYQRHDDPPGDWVTDETRVHVKGPGSLTFKNFNNRVGESYIATGKFHGKRQITGIWSETQGGGTAGGTFHLYVDPFGQTLYGVCTGPTRRGAMIYSGWILARQRKALDLAQRELTAAMLLCGSQVVPGNRKVFVVHGHNRKHAKRLKEIVSQFRLRPIILHEQKNMGKTIIEKFEHYAPQCGFALVLLTPDDKIRTRNSTEAKWRARQNVIMELGWFMARLGRGRVALLYTGKLDIPSDILGVVYLEFERSVSEVKAKLRKELKGAGLLT